MGLESENVKFYHRPNTIKKMAPSEEFCHNNDETKPIVIDCDCMNLNVTMITMMTILNYGYETNSIQHS